jgi:hypothetical protein
MTNKLVVIINSLKVPKIKSILLYEMIFLVPNYSCLQNTWLGGYRPQIPVLSVLCPQLNLLNPPPRTKFLGTPLITTTTSRLRLQWKKSSTVIYGLRYTDCHVRSANKEVWLVGYSACITDVSVVRAKWSKNLGDAKLGAWITLKRILVKQKKNMWALDITSEN